MPFPNLLQQISSAFARQVLVIVRLRQTEPIPERILRAALGGFPLRWIRLRPQARVAMARVLKNMVAQSHLSIRTERMI